MTLGGARLGVSMSSASLGVSMLWAASTWCGVEFMGIPVARSSLVSTMFPPRGSLFSERSNCWFVLEICCSPWNCEGQTPEGRGSGSDLAVASPRGEVAPEGCEIWEAF